MNKKDENKKKNSRPNPWQDDNFYYIAGYTSGGAPFGITWEEHYRMMEKDSQDSESTGNNVEVNPDNNLFDGDIPF